MPFVLSRIAKMDYSEFFKKIGSIAKKQNKSSFSVFCDMVSCGILYQAGYHDYEEFEFYLMNSQKRRTYLTRGKNNKIIRKYNDKRFISYFDNKVVFNKTFSSFLHRDWIDLRGSTKSVADKFLSEHEFFIAKIIDGMCGNGIEKYKSDEVELSSLLERKQYLLEQCIEQHPEMDRLCNTSVNSLRVFTFHDGENSHFLQAVLKAGNGGVTDNFCNGGMYAFVEDDGVVRVPAIDGNNNVFEKHPSSGVSFIGFQIPMFDKIKSFAEEIAYVVPEVKYVGWDIAVGKDGPILIEGNFYPGIFQKRASFSEEGILLLYKKYIKI